MGDPSPTVDAIFFDFDGVILDSVEFKEVVFRNIIGRHAPEHIESIMQYYWQNGGVSRLEKFQWIWKNLLGRTLGEAELDMLGREFSQSVYDMMLRCDFVDGAEQFLHQHHADWPFFIISGTPQAELIRIVEGRKLDRFFRGVFGSPPGKAQIGERILSEHDLVRRRVWFVGDATTDRDAAHRLGVRFVGIAGPHLSPYLEGDEITIEDLGELSAILLHSGK